MTLATDLPRPGHLTTAAAPTTSRPPRGDGSRRRAQSASDRATTGRPDQLLFERYQRDGDLHARRVLIERYLPLARSLARRYERRGEPLDDLVQVASLGLVKAIDRFDTERGPSFASYAIPTMLGELRRYFRDSGWALRVPREMQERVLRVNRATERLSGELGRSPSPREVADQLNMSVEEALEAIAANAAYDTAPLDTPLGAEKDERGSVAETFGETDERFELIEERASIDPALKALSERERRILHLRFVDDLTQSEIAQRVGISQMHVSRLTRRALEQMRIVAEKAA